jgi:hypothetical protein
MDLSKLSVTQQRQLLVENNFMGNLLMRNIVEGNVFAQKLAENFDLNFKQSKHIRLQFYCAQSA